MVEYGQYPLVLQKDTVNGQLIPVGLAEASSLTFQSLSAITVCATNYVNLPTFGGNFTGIQNVCSVGVCGTSLIDTATGDTLTLKNIFVNLDTFVGVTSPAGAHIELSFNQPLAAVRGGTGSTGGLLGEIPHWNNGETLVTDPNFNYGGGFLNAPKVDTPGGGGYYVDGNPFDLGHLDSVNLATPPSDNQLLSYDSATNKWVARDESALASLPVDPCAIIFNDAAGTPSTDPVDLTYHGNTIKFPNALATGNITANTFIENGVSLSTKYQIADTTLCALGDLTILPNNLLYFDAGSNAALSPITSNARELLNDIQYSDMRTTLGLGTIATRNGIALDSADVCNTLPIANGGTGSTSLTTPNGIVYSNGSNLLQIAAPTASDQSLKWTGGAFSWAVIPTGTFVSPTDPCAIVFVNTAGTNIISSPNLIYNPVTNSLGVGNVNAVGYVAAGGNIAGNDIIAAGNVYEGATTLSNKYQGKDSFLTTLATQDYVNLNSADVCNTLPVTKGGLGKTTLANNSLLYGNGTGAVNEVAAPTTNNTFLKWNSGFSWATNPEQWTHVFKPANQKISTTTYTNDTELAATTVNGNNYIIKYSIYFSANTTNRISTQVDITPGYQSFTYRINYIPPGTIVDSMVKAGAIDAFDYQGSVATNGAGYLELDCVIVNVKDTSVPIQFKLSSSGGSDELFILKGSHLKYTTF